LSQRRIQAGLLRPRVGAGLRLAGTSTRAVSLFRVRRLHCCFFARGQSPLKRKGEQHLAKYGIVGLFSGAGAVSGMVFVNLS
jgi:hypothetical protein